MWRCPKCNVEVADSQKACWTCGTAVDGIESAGLPLPAADKSGRPKPYRSFCLWCRSIRTAQVVIPRRFGTRHDHDPYGGVRRVVQRVYVARRSAGGLCRHSDLRCLDRSVSGVAVQGEEPAKRFHRGRSCFRLGVHDLHIPSVGAARERLGGTESIFLALGNAFLWGTFWGGVLGYAVGCLIATIFLVRKAPDDTPSPAEAVITLMVADKPSRSAPAAASGPAATVRHRHADDPHGGVRCVVERVENADASQVFVCVSIFVAGVAACQAILFGGNNRRKASFVGGYIVGSLIFVGVLIVRGILLGKTSGGTVSTRCYGPFFLPFCCLE